MDPASLCQGQGCCGLPRKTAQPACIPAAEMCETRAASRRWTWRWGGEAIWTGLLRCVTVLAFRVWLFHQ